MIRVFDFKCRRCAAVAEFFVDTRDWKDGDDVPCPMCHGPAARLVPAPRAQLEGFTGAFPGAAAKWEQRRESHMKKERKNQENHGTYK